LYVESGRVADRDGQALLTGLRKIAQIHTGEFRLTPNQNLIIARVAAEGRAAIDQLVQAHGLDSWNRLTPLRLHSLACVGLPTCALAMAESERYLPELLEQIDRLMAVHGLQDQAITLRVTGCPNGCARPYLAEIGLVGKGPGLYNLHLGAAFNGTRMNRLVGESLHQEDVLRLLDGLFGRYVQQRMPDEGFGDYLHRSGALQDTERQESNTDER
jgi:sulfite reductase (NADPH) hemoprotein beta-component